MQIDRDVAMVTPDAATTTGTMHVSRMPTPNMHADSALCKTLFRVGHTGLKSWKSKVELELTL